MTVIARKPTAAERQDAARMAGAKGRSAAPMEPGRRLSNYDGGTARPLTPAQRKRHLKKARALAAKGGAS